MKLCADPETAPGPDGLARSIRPELLKVFKPALLGRMDVVPYLPIGDDALRRIIRLQLGRVASRLRDRHRAEFAYDDTLVEHIAGRCTEVESGARNVDHIINRSLLPELSREFLGRMASGSGISRVGVSIDQDGGFRYEIG
jgi:type VI secretion system protein VasG